MAFELPQLGYAYDALEPTLMRVPWKSTTGNTMQDTRQS